MSFAGSGTEQDARPLLDAAKKKASRFWHLSFAHLLATNRVQSAEVVEDPKYGELMSVSDGQHAYFLPMDDRNIFIVKKGEEILFFYGNLRACSESPQQ